MKKKENRYEGSVEKFLSKKIYINVNNLEEGVYEIRIVYKNRIVKVIRFVHNKTM